MTADSAARPRRSASGVPRSRRISAATPRPGGRHGAGSNLRKPTKWAIDVPLKPGGVQFVGLVACAREVVALIIIIDSLPFPPFPVFVQRFQTDQSDKM